ncbi:MAG: hypothetical protein EOM12_08830 [Verrucomicrobiae bacterium]|nr:hypothetical protein [Verrucomicrobiae bacterium]
MKDQEWDIKSRADSCGVCGRKFEDNEEFFARLSFGDEGYQRMDSCLTCWDEQDQSDAVSMWKSVYRLPPPPPAEALKKETAESLLRRLIEDDDPASLNTIYILAVMLERRRMLVEQDLQKRDDGSLIRVYEYKKTGEVFLIPDPQLKLSELEHVQEEVVIMLGGEPRKGKNGEKMGKNGKNEENPPKNEENSEKSPENVVN